MQKFLLGCFVACVSCIASAASFDCSKAKTFIEQAICDNPVLSGLDDELGIIFNQVKNKVGDSEEFKIIAKGNFALRTKCQDDICLEKWLRNSIELYSYLNVYLPADELAAYPEDVRQACAGDQAITVEFVDCSNAKTQFHEVQSQQILKEILAMKISDERKASAKELLERGKKDANYYCGIAADVPGTISRLIAADCYLSWAKKIQDLLSTQKETWEDELDIQNTQTEDTQS